MAIAALFGSSITAHFRKHKEIQPITKKFNNIVGIGQRALDGEVYGWCTRIKQLSNTKLKIVFRVQYKKQLLNLIEHCY